jgi:hypothetical protein
MAKISRCKAESKDKPVWGQQGSENPTLALCVLVQWGLQCAKVLRGGAGLERPMGVVSKVTSMVCIGLISLHTFKSSWSALKALGAWHGAWGEALAALGCRLLLIVLSSICLVIVTLALVGFGHALSRAGEANFTKVSLCL